MNAKDKNNIDKNNKDKNNINDKIKNLPNKNITNNTKNNLDLTIEHIRKWFVLGEPEIVAAALYVALTHVYRSFYVIPYLYIKSAVAGSGKTNLIQLLRPMVWNETNADDITPASLSALAHRGCTFLIDQLDTLMGRDKELARTLEGVFNGGYKASGSRIKMNNDNIGTIKLSTFTPKIFAGIEIPLADSTMSRCITLEIKKATNKELDTIEEFYLEDIDPAGIIINDMWSEWAEGMSESFKAKKVMKLPDKLDPRGKEIWKPMLRIAELAGKEWYQKAWDACLNLAIKPREKDASEHVLEDIKKVFEDLGNPTRIESQVLVNALMKYEESGWYEYKGNGLTVHNLPKLLRRFHADTAGTKRIQPTKWAGAGGETKRGYLLADFKAAWSRLDQSSEVATSATSASDMATMATMAAPENTEFIYDPNNPLSESQQRQKFNMNWGD